eukprot:SAG22_NODE_9978_length_560_cov_1.008677_1_plen_44_part_10
MQAGCTCSGQLALLLRQRVQPRLLGSTNVVVRNNTIETWNEHHA